MAKKLLYRSKQRGFLELDLLVGLWAEQAIPRMSVEKLRHLEVLLDEVRPGGMVLGTEAAPPHVHCGICFLLVEQVIPLHAAEPLHLSLCCRVR